MARTKLMLSGREFEFGSLEESLAISAINNEAKTEYLKMLAVTNAIVQTGNAIRAQIAGTDYKPGDGLKNVLEALKEQLMPHMVEADKTKLDKIRDRLIKEASGGEIKFKIMGDTKETNKRKRRRR